jgi:succinoglycan biosynthesis transport protein ExoP
VHELCVRAEASELAGRSLVVAVAGADESAGTTTTALAMAVRFAEAGSDVLLVDMDIRTPDLTESVGEALSGVRYLATPEPDAEGRRPSRSRPPLIGSVLPGVRFAGQGDPGSRRPLRRDEVGRLLDHSAEYAAVTVIDAGVLMDAASSVQLAQTADALVLTVPLARQRRSALRVCARQLRTARGTILPVITAATSRHRDNQAPPTPGPASEEQPVPAPESAPAP